MSCKRTVNRILALDASTSGVSKPIRVTDYQHIVFSVEGPGGSDRTVKVQGSIGQGNPNFSASSAVGNMWDYIEVIQLSDGTKVAGGTGISQSTDNLTLYKVNVSALDYISFEVSGGTTGSVTCNVVALSNE